MHLPSVIIISTSVGSVNAIICQYVLIIGFSAKKQAKNPQNSTKKDARPSPLPSIKTRRNIYFNCVTDLLKRKALSGEPYSNSFGKSTIKA